MAIYPKLGHLFNRFVGAAPVKSGFILFPVLSQEPRFNLSGDGSDTRPTLKKLNTINAAAKR